MDFELSEELKMFQDSLRLFAEKEIGPLVNEAEDKEKFPVQLYSRMGDLGYLCVGYPAEYGGAGLGKAGECVVAEELARISLGICSSIMVTSGVATSAIARHGSKAQQDAYLLPTVKGRKIASFALTEPNAGSDAAAIEAKAVKGPNGYTINGQKIFITNGPIADFVVTAAYTDKTKPAANGVSLFIVEKGTPGLISTKMHKAALRSSDTAELQYDNVVVPVDNLIGEEGAGFRYLMESLSGGRITIGAGRLGLAGVAYEASLAYAKDRKQFGQAIGKFQSIAFMLADMAVQIQAARWLVYHSAWLYDGGKKCLKEASMAKLFATEMAVRVADCAMQIHGGYSFTSDSPIQRYSRDARVGLVVEGTSEIQRLVISREIGVG